MRFFACLFVPAKGKTGRKKMIIDVHCHILPGVDDGAKNPQVTRKMLEIARSEGIDAIIATPHFESGMTPEFLARRAGAMRITEELAAEFDPEIKIYQGNEIFYGESAIEALDRGEAKTINGTDYVLVEFPVYAEFGYIEKAIRNIMYAGYKPVIAHIERYEGMSKKHQVEELSNHGVLMQVNASTLTGAMGFGIKHYVFKLMKAGLIDLIGTDAHGVNRRRPEMREAIRVIDKKFGVAYRRLLCEANPERMLRGEKISGKTGF